MTRIVESTIPNNYPEHAYGTRPVSWSPRLIEVRRQSCPLARWQKQKRCWTMTEHDATTFLNVAHLALDYERWHTQVIVDDVVWVIGFVQGAPYALTPDQAALSGTTKARIPTTAKVGCSAPATT